MVGAFQRRVRWVEPVVVVAVSLVLAVYYVRDAVHDMRVVVARDPSRALFADTRPVMHAGALVLSGHGNIYAPWNSYPALPYFPTSALLLAPISHLGLHTQFYLLGTVNLLAIAVACVLLLRTCRVRYPLPLGLLAAFAVYFGHDSHNSLLYLENLDVLLLPFVILTLVLWANDKWEAGTYVLMATALVKPMFVPLILIPLLRRQIRPLVRPAVVGAVLVGLSALITPGGQNIVHLPKYLAGGTTLRGGLRVADLTIAAQGSFRHYPHDLITLGRVAVLVIGLVGCWSFARRRSLEPRSTIVFGTLLLLVSFLDGSLSETGYWIFYAPALILGLISGDVIVTVLSLAAGVVFAIPTNVLQIGNRSLSQTRLRSFIGELLALLAVTAYLGLVARRTAARTDSATPGSGRFRRPGPAGASRSRPSGRSLARPPLRSALEGDRSR